MGRYKQNDNPLEMECLDIEYRSIAGTSFATPKEFSLKNKILRLVAQGYSSRDIALHLNVSRGTIITYRFKLMRSAKDQKLETVSQSKTRQSIGLTYRMDLTRPPINAEYLLYLLLRKDEREVLIGDLLECYELMVQRFDKQHADVWFYKQVIGSILPLLRRALVRIGALVWLGRVLRRLIS